MHSLRRSKTAEPRGKESGEETQKRRMGSEEEANDRSIGEAEGAEREGQDERVLAQPINATLTPASSTTLVARVVFIRCV